MIIQPQDYEITFLEEHNALHKLIFMEKSSLSSQNFNQSVVKILSIHKTNWINKDKAKEKKMWQKKVERNSKDFAKMEERLKGSGAGQERRGKWIRINISSSIAWLLRKKCPYNPILSCCKWSFCWLCITHFEAEPLNWHYSSNCKWSLSLIWRTFFFNCFTFS